MKCLFTTIIIFAFSLNAGATERAFHNYVHSNLNFSFCYELTSYDPEERLYYRGLSALLNEYIRQKTANGGLDNRKFEIQAGCTTFGIHPAVEVSRSKRGYYVFIHGDIIFKRLVRIVDYFASKDWRSFCYDYESVKPEVAVKLFDAQVDEVLGAFEPGSIENKSIGVWELGGLHIMYRPDELYYQFNGSPSSFRQAHTLPVKLDDRYFYVTDGAIQVIEEGRVVLEQLIPDYDDIMPYLYSMKSYRKWVNVYYREDPILSYSYEANRFFSIQNDN